MIRACRALPGRSKAPDRPSDNTMPRRAATRPLLRRRVLARITLSELQSLIKRRDPPYFYVG